MTQKCPVSVPVLIALFFFGILYNALVERLLDRGHDRGYMSFIVAIGTGVTLTGIAIVLGLETAAWATACFIASGLPMIWGSVNRHVRQRGRAQACTWEKARETLDANDQKT